METRSPKRARILAILAAVVLTFLHLDFWRPQHPRLVAGWIPEELLYRFVWILLAWVWILYVSERVWREEES